MELDSFYLDQEEPNKGCFLALRQIILAKHEFISETRKYGMPCFLYQKKILCYLWKDKKSKEPYILMVDGNLLNHPALETGDRARMKIFRVNPQKDIPIRTIDEILDEAISLCT